MARVKHAWYVFIAEKSPEIKLKIVGGPLFNPNDQIKIAIDVTLRFPTQVQQAPQYCTVVGSINR